MQDGWIKSQTDLGETTRVPKMVQRPDPMTKPCQYQKHDKFADPGCVCCRWKEVPIVN